MLEIESWAGAGVPLATIFWAATLDHARTFRLEDEIEDLTGHAGRFVAAAIKPIGNAAANDDIEMVLVDGVPLKRGGLAAR